MQICRCIKCRHKEHFAKDLLEHMHREDHMDEPFVHCPQCKAAFEMEKIQGRNSIDIWNLRLELMHRLRQELRTHLGTHFLVVG